MCPKYSTQVLKKNYYSTHLQCPTKKSATHPSCLPTISTWFDKYQLTFSIRLPAHERSHRWPDKDDHQLDDKHEGGLQQPVVDLHVLEHLQARARRTPDLLDTPGKE